MSTRDARLFKNLIWSTFFSTQPVRKPQRRRPLLVSCDFRFTKGLVHQLDFYRSSTSRSSTSKGATAPWRARCLNRFSPLQLDLFAPLPTSRSCRLLLAYVDRLSRWSAAFPFLKINGIPTSLYPNIRSNQSPAELLVSYVLTYSKGALNRVRRFAQSLDPADGRSKEKLWCVYPRLPTCFRMFMRDD